MITWHELLGTTEEEKFKSFLWLMQFIIVALALVLVWSHYSYIALHHTVYSGCSLLCMNSTSCAQRCYTYYTYPPAQVQKLRYDEVMSREAYKYENTISYDWMEQYRGPSWEEKVVRDMREGANSSIWE